MVAEETDQWGKHLSHKCENWNSDPWNLHKSQSSHRETETGVCRLTSLARLGKFWVQQVAKLQ